MTVWWKGSQGLPNSILYLQEMFKALKVFFCLKKKFAGLEGLEGILPFLLS